jgi:hypothetical protein
MKALTTAPGTDTMHPISNARVETFSAAANTILFPLMKRKIGGEGVTKNIFLITNGVKSNPVMRRAPFADMNSVASAGL